MGVKVNLSGVSRKINTICGNDKVGRFIAETTARHANQYIPMDTGVLSQTYDTEPFVIKYKAPYARRVFYGEGYNFSKEKHPLACARWDKATSAGQGKAIARETEKFIRGFK